MASGSATSRTPSGVLALPLERDAEVIYTMVENMRIGTTVGPGVEEKFLNLCTVFWRVAVLALRHQASPTSTVMSATCL